MKISYNLYTKTNQKIVDSLIVTVSFAAAYLIRFEGVPDWNISRQFLIWLPCLVSAHLLLNSQQGVYRFIWRYFSLPDALAIGRSHSVISGLALALRIFYPDKSIFAEQLRLPLSVIALEYLLSLAGFIGARVLRRVLYQRMAAPASQAERPRRLLLIGAGNAATLVAKELMRDPKTHVVGFLDDDPHKAGALICGKPVLGQLSSLESVAKEQAVDEVVICIVQPQRTLLKRFWALRENLNIPIRIVPTLEEIMRGDVDIVAFRNVRIDDLLGRETAEIDVGDGLDAAYRNKSILLTGAGGSIGSELAHQLVNLTPRKLVLLDKDENGLHDVYVQLKAAFPEILIYPVVGDVRSRECLDTVLERFRPDVIFHAAAHKHVPLMEMNPCEAIRNNVFGTHNLLERSRRFGISRFVLISTDKAVRPTSIMGASKRICEMLVQLHSDRALGVYCSVRFGNVIGSRGSVIPHFQQQIARGGPVTVTHSEMRRFLMTIPEAVRLVMAAGTLEARGNIFVLDMGDPVPIVNIARDLIELSGLQPGRDVKIQITELRPGEKISEELIDESREALSPTSISRIGVISSQSFDRTAFLSKLALLEDAARREAAVEIYSILHDFGFEYDPEPIVPNTKIRKIQPNYVNPCL